MVVDRALQATRAGLRHALVQARDLLVDDGIAGVVGVREMRHQARDLDQPASRGRNQALEDVRPVLEEDAGTIEAGVEFGGHARPAARAARGLEHRVQVGGAGDGEVDAGLHGGADIVGRLIEPGQDLGVDPRRPQLERLGDRGDAQRGGAPAQRGQRDRDGAMAVRVGLHHGHHARARGMPDQDAGIVLHRVQIDLGTARGRGDNRGHSVNSAKETPPGAIHTPRSVATATGTAASRSEAPMGAPGPAGPPAPGPAGCTS